MSIKVVLVPSLVAMLLALATSAQAIPILGEQLFYAGGDVTIESLEVSSGYTSELGLYNSAFTRVLYLMNDEPQNVVVTFNPDDYGFSVGDELIFGIRVVSEGNEEYFTGLAARNPDAVVHAGVDNIGGGMFVVGFEDIFGGGDFDYDDNRFQFEGGIITPTAVPEPATLSLIGFGLVAARRYRRRS